MLRLEISFATRSLRVCSLTTQGKKEILIHLFASANNFDASDEELHSAFLDAKQGGIRITWEYIDMMFMQLGGQEFLVRYPKNATFQELTNFYERHASLPIIAEKKTSFFSKSV